MNFQYFQKKIFLPFLNIFWIHIFFLTSVKDSEFSNPNFFFFSEFYWTISKNIFHHLITKFSTLILNFPFSPFLFRIFPYSSLVFSGIFDIPVIIDFCQKSIFLLLLRCLFPDFSDFLCFLFFCDFLDKLHKCLYQIDLYFI